MVLVWYLTGYMDQISDNDISGNMRGIELGSSNTVIYRNNITENRVNGIYVQTSSNIIAANSITNNLVGLYIALNFITSSNKIYNNNFINNSQNALHGFIATTFNLGTTVTQQVATTGVTIQALM